MTTRARRGATFLTLLGLALSASSCSADGTITIGARYSRFDPATLEVRAGDPLTFVVTNRDPIPHEFILGTIAEQLEHEEGTDIDHDGTPGAASLAPNETETVTFTFDEPGTYRYACHLEGHYAYGMFGTITVR
jgi:uncharacterized cupredoxin-like copper-binding protein